MSQIRFRYNGFRVLTGWDRPLQMHFLVVEKEGQDEPVYSNLSDLTLPSPGRMSPDQVVLKLEELDILVPSILRKDLITHQLGNFGNVDVEYI